mgnify:FL=1
MADSALITSTDNPTAQPFVSILSLDPLRDAGCQLSRVHAIYGSSKDWSSNGLRIGALISQGNPELHAAMESSCLLMKISSAAVRPSLLCTQRPMLMPG